MSCCPQCVGIEEQFGRKRAARELRRYRRRGPDRPTRLLIEALRAQGVEGLTLLDVGGGVGAIQHELMHAGARSATHVDASAAYLEAARDEARRRGHAERITRLHGDFVELAEHVPAADVVTLDKVICCYPEMERLVAESAARARELYGLVYPRERVALRVGLRLGNAFLRLRGSPFRAYLHSSAAVDATVRDQGLRRLSYRTTAMWQIVVYGR
jgi:magnesium-protoporphyrin O-methyltransferase